MRGHPCAQHVHVTSLHPRVMVTVTVRISVIGCGFLRRRAHGPTAELRHEVVDLDVDEAKVVPVRRRRRIPPACDRPGELLVGKSTVPVGTAAWLAETVSAKIPGAILVRNPESLREGYAVPEPFVRTGSCTDGRRGQDGEIACVERRRAAAVAGRDPAGHRSGRDRETPGSTGCNDPVERADLCCCSRSGPLLGSLTP